MKALYMKTKEFNLSVCDYCVTCLLDCERVCLCVCARARVRVYGWVGGCPSFVERERGCVCGGEGGGLPAVCMPYMCAYMYALYVCLFSGGQISLFCPYMCLHRCPYLCPSVWPYMCMFPYMCPYVCDCLVVPVSLLLCQKSPTNVGIGTDA